MGKSRPRSVSIDKHKKMLVTNNNQQIPLTCMTTLCSLWTVLKTGVPFLVAEKQNEFQI